jgi:hypothetical protein
MKECKHIKTQLTALLSGEVSTQEQDRVESHLEICPGCRREYQVLSGIVKDIGDLNGEARRVTDTLDWDRAAADIGRRVRLTAESADKRVGQPVLGWRVLAPAMAAMLAVGIMLGYFLFHSQSPFLSRDLPEPGVEVEQPILLNRIESRLDQRQVLDYLKQSQLVLMDFMRQSEDLHWPREKQPLYIARARSLLGKKHYFSRSLEGSRLAAARSLVEQIQWVFMEMVAIDEAPVASTDQVRRLRAFIERERVFLKIRLIERELSGKLNEV